MSWIGDDAELRILMPITFRMGGPANAFNNSGAAPFAAARGLECIKCALSEVGTLQKDSNDCLPVRSLFMLYDSHDM
jgi:hypothetical protein